MGKTAIVYTVDDNKDVWFQLISSLRSVRTFEPERFDVFILTEAKKTWMRGLYGTEIIEVADVVKSLGIDKTGINWARKPVPAMLLFRLFLPLVDRLRTYDKILYLDSDTEVWRSEFFTLLDIPLDNEIIAIQDSLNVRGTGFRIRPMLKAIDKGNSLAMENWGKLVSGEKRYVNSGVLVINNKKLQLGYESRARYILQQLMSLKPGFPDQDILNIFYDILVVHDRKFNAWGMNDRDVYLRHYVRSNRRRSRQYPPHSNHRPTSKLDGIYYTGNLGVLSGLINHIYILSENSDPSEVLANAKWLKDVSEENVTVISTAHTGKYNDLLNSIPTKITDRRHLDNWMGHYKAVTDGMSKGYEKIAIFEDTFQPNDIDSVYDSLGKDFDIVICTGHGPFVRARYPAMASSRGYMLNIKGMFALRRLFESLWDDSVTDRHIRYVHHWVSGDTFKNFRAYNRLGKIG